MGSKSRPSGTTTTVQNSEPWAPQQPYLTDIFSEAQALYQGGGPQYFPGWATAGPQYLPNSTYVQPSQGQWDALGAISALGANDPMWQPAFDMNASLLRGDYLYSNPAMGLLTNFANTNFGTGAPGDDALMAYASGEHLGEGNPYIDALTSSIMSKVVPKLQSNFIMGGTLSSPEAARATAEGATSAISPFLFQQYQQDQQNQINAANALAQRYLQGAGLQQQAAGGLSAAYQSAFGDVLKGLALAPQTQQIPYTGLQNWFTAESANQNLHQQALNDAIQRWNYEQTLPWNMLNQYIGQATGNYGGTTTLTQPYFSNRPSPFSGAIGGASMGSSFGWPGALIGGGIGLLSSFFG